MIQLHIQFKVVHYQWFKFKYFKWCNYWNTLAVSSDTTSNFTLRATAGSKTADRAFNIVVLNDTVTDHASSNWSELST